MKRHIKNMAVIASVALATTGLMADDGSKPADTSKPVKVFLLLGQSNMVGMGKYAVLEKAVKEKKLYPYLVDKDGKWVERQDVRFVHYQSGRGPLRNEFLCVKPGNIGVEYAAGHALGNALEDPVMLLKACIGNRGLGWDLLPPGSERFEAVKKDKTGAEKTYVYAGYKDSPANWEKGTEPKSIGWYAGKQWDDDIGDAKKALADLEKHYPGATKYEVAGFFFWQGEKDAADPVWAENYEKNLVNFIKALRKEFNAPNAKFVLGTMGEATKDRTDNTGIILKAHLAVDGTSGKHPEFKGNVATIYTNPLAQGGGGNGHYGGNAEVYMNVGEAMGKAMVELLNSK
jgi:Carbohydrate esterase, sialic acid-specific acetylesterase